MKLKQFIFLSLLPLTLSSCSFILNRSISETSSSTSTNYPNAIEVSFTSINDFHGAINETDSQPGLAKLATYLKGKKSEGNILINAGDMWQGTFQTNYNRGKLVTEAFNDIGFDAEILGNHEFDWGIDKIKENQEISRTNYLCANIKKYNESGVPSYVGEKYELGKDYNVVTINKDSEKELKVGLIGVIGKDQLTSIESKKSEGIIFYEPTEIVKDLAIKLRNDENCDVVGAIYHANYTAIDESLAEYVDVFFGAHTHQVESTFIGNKPYAQAGCNGAYASNITLTVNKNTKEVKYVSSDVEYAYDDYKMVEKIPHTIKEDETIKTLIDKYAEESSLVANKEVGKITSSFSKAQVSNALAKGMYKISKDKYGKDIALAITNTARNPISKNGTVYYSDLVTAVPFDNEIVIMEAKGYNIKDEMNFGNYYYGDDIPSFEDNTYYTIAVCSYVAYHINVNDNYERYLNYFATQRNSYELVDENNNKIYYRDGLEYLFQTASNNTLNPMDFMYI